MAIFKFGNCLVFPTGRDGEYSVIFICNLPLLFSVLNMQALAFGVTTSAKNFIMNNEWIRGHLKFFVLLL